VPGDFSSAAFFIVASLLIPDSEITVKNVGINPTRTGLLEVLKKMGARIEILNIRNVSGEPVADICCRGKSELNAVQINEETIPSMIDEFPIVCIAAAFAEGKTTIKGAEELRVKESDRIKSITSELRKMGVEIEEYTDGLSIAGTASLHGANLDSYRDHRIAMALAVAALAAEGKTTINGASSADISFPGFFDTIRMLSS
jgi:3-phosphoshikimate 1-carboxyvinyltransferase